MADTERALNNVAQTGGDVHDDVILEFINPHIGSPVMKSFTCSIQMLRPGAHTKAHRHTGSWIYLCFEGAGATIIDDVRFDWSAGDMFVLPSWAVHEHLNGSDHERAILFAVHDTPLLQAVDKYRVEVGSQEHQTVTSNFSEDA